MKKMIFKIAAAALLIGGLAFNFVLNTSESNTPNVTINLEGLTNQALAQSSERYQSMAYCSPWKITKACTTQPRAFHCSSYDCLVSY